MCGRGLLSIIEPIGWAYPSFSMSPYTSVPIRFNCGSDGNRLVQTNETSAQKRQNSGISIRFRLFLGRKAGGKVAKAGRNREKSNSIKIGQRKNKEKQKNTKNGIPSQSLSFSTDFANKSYHPQKTPI
jgi:hypothetical protein